MAGLALLITLSCISVLLLSLMKVAVQIEEIKGRAHRFAEDLRWKLSNE